MCHYDGKINKLSKNWPHLFPGSFLTKLWTKTWYLFMEYDTAIDCKWKLECFSVLDIENARKLGKFAKFFLMIRVPRKTVGKMTKKVVRNSEIFPRKCRNLFGGPRTETKFVKWSASRKRLRTADVGYSELLRQRLFQASSASKVKLICCQKWEFGHICHVQEAR